jgi:hypothetical protein
MAGSLQRFVGGEPLRLNATTMNAWTEAAEANRQNNGRLSVNNKGVYDPARIQIRNESGDARERFEILAINPDNGVVLDPTDNLDAFQNQPVFIGHTPIEGDKGRFVVLTEPLAAGDIGKSIALGVIVVKVDVINPAHEYAEITPGETGFLTSTPDGGSARILYVEPGTGENWAVVRIGDPPAPLKVEFCEPSATPAAADSADYLSVDVTDPNGLDIEPVEAINVFGRRDRGRVLWGRFGWTDTTVLSFTRFPSPVLHEAVLVDGVLVGSQPEGGQDPTDNPMSLDKWYYIKADLGWTTIDTRDWRGRWIWINMIDSDTDIDEFADDDVEHWDSIAMAYAKQSTQPHAWFKTLLYTNPLGPQAITRDIFSPGVLDSGDFYMRMKTTGEIEISVENWTGDFSVRFSMRTNHAPPPAAETID